MTITQSQAATNPTRSAADPGGYSLLGLEHRPCSCQTWSGRSRPPEGDAPHPGKMMLTMPGKPERTTSEYRPLMSRSGFRVAQIVPTDSAVKTIAAGPI